VILGAALLVLAGLGLFVAGVLTGVTALYWACVAVCAVAAVLLIASRRKAPPARPAARPAEKAATSTAPRTAETPKVVAEPATAAEPATTVSEPPAAPAEPPESAPAPAEASTEVHATAHRTSPAGATATGAPTTGSLRAQRRGAHAAADEPAGGPSAIEEPGVEEVEVTDLLLVVDLTDEVLVVDEHPRYHLEGCRFLAGRETFPLPLDEARTDGFTPCALCAPDRHLADRERARKAARGH
jgi:hypothetical protein